MGVRDLVARRLGFSRKTPWIPPADVMAAVLEHSTDAVIVVARDDPALRICYLNPAFEALTGYGRDEAIGKSCGFLLGDDRLQPEIALIRAAIEARAPIAVTLRSYRRDGSMFGNALRMFSVVEASNQQLYLVGVMRDVTPTGHHDEFDHEGGKGTCCSLPSGGKPRCATEAESEFRIVEATFCIDTGVISDGECVGKMQRLSPRERRRVERAGRGLQQQEDCPQTRYKPAHCRGLPCESDGQAWCQDAVGNLADRLHGRAHPILMNPVRLVGSHESLTKASWLAARGQAHRFEVPADHKSMNSAGTREV